MILRANTATEISFFMPDATDPWTGKTGLTGITVEYHKQGAISWTTLTAPTINEVGYGFYRLSVPATVVDTMGFLEFRFTATGAKTQHYVYQVVAYNPYDAAGLGLSNLDAAVSSRATDAGVWGYTTRTLTSFGTLVSDIWNYSARTLTSFGTLVADIWSYSTRTLTSFGTLVSDIWSYVTRTLTSAVDINMGQTLPASPSPNTTGEALKFADTRLDAAVSTRAAPGDILITPANKLATDAAGKVSVGSYATGQSPSEQVLVTPANKLATDTAGRVTVGDYAATKSPGEQVLATPANKLATDVSGRVTVGTNADKTDYSLTASERSSIASAVWSFISEGTYTMLNIMRLISSALFGKVSGAQTNTPTFRDLLDTKNRITMTTDNDGNRTSVTLDGN